MQTFSFNLNELKNKINSNHFRIPQFQRNFVWKDSDTRRLIDSIARNYPIGSLLILEVDKESQFASRPLNYYAKRDDNVDDNRDDCIDEYNTTDSTGSYYVLDGQQRLTSMARVFNDSYEKKIYYFDLKKMYEAFVIEDDSYEYDWIQSSTRSGESLFRKDDNKLVRADMAIDQKKCSTYVSEYFEESHEFNHLSKNEKRSAIAVLNGVFETIRNFSVPFICLKYDTPLETICRVFETINSTGTKLSTFDLAVARYHPNLKIRDMFDSSKNDDSILKNYKHFDGESILNILALCSLREKNKDKIPEATRSVLLSLDIKFIKENWDESVKCYSESIKLANTWGIKAPPTRIMIPIAATFLIFKDSLKNNDILKTLKNWYFCNTLTTESIKSNNHKLGSDFKNLCDYIDEQRESKQLIKFNFPKISLNFNDIIEASQNSNLFKTITSILKQEVQKNEFFTDENIIFNEEEEIFLHNIFPKVKKFGFESKKIESIANKLIISKKSSEDYKNLLPETYLIDYLKKYKDKSKIEKRLKLYDIPINIYDQNSYNILKKDCFDQFIEKRAEKIIEKLRTHFYDVWEDS